jgi:hypothetical protein
MNGECAALQKINSTGDVNVHHSERFTRLTLGIGRDGRGMYDSVNIIRVQCIIDVGCRTDVTYYQLRFPSAKVAHQHGGWYGTVKEHHTLTIGKQPFGQSQTNKPTSSCNHCGHMIVPSVERACAAQVGQPSGP